MALEAVRARIRDVPDFPKKGIVFKDITPVLSDPATFREVIDALVARWKDARISKVVGIESRGFLFAAPLAYALGAGLTLARKPGKLPWETIREVYALEYGENALELHPDLIPRGSRVVIHDDVLATGGTVAAIRGLVEQLGGEVVGACFIIELTFLGGREKLAGMDLHTLISY